MKYSYFPTIPFYGIYYTVLFISYLASEDYCEGKDCSGRGNCANGIDTYKCKCFDDPDVIIGGKDCEMGKLLILVHVHG